MADLMKQKHSLIQREVPGLVVAIMVKDKRLAIFIPTTINLTYDSRALLNR